MDFFALFCCCGLNVSAEEINKGANIFAVYSFA